MGKKSNEYVKKFLGAIVKLTIVSGNASYIYSGKILRVDEEFITILDKFNQEVGLRISNLTQITKLNKESLRKCCNKS